MRESKTVNTCDKLSLQIIVTQIIIQIFSLVDFPLWEIFIFLFIFKKIALKHLHIMYYKKNIILIKPVLNHLQINVFHLNNFLS